MGFVASSLNLTGGATRIINVVRIRTVNVILEKTVLTAFSIKKIKNKKTFSRWVCIWVRGD